VLKIVENLWAVGILPQTQLRELTALPRPHDRWGGGLLSPEPHAHAFGLDFWSFDLGLQSCACPCDSKLLVIPHLMQQSENQLLGCLILLSKFFECPRLGGSGDRHSVHRPGRSMGGAGIQFRGSAGRFRVWISGAHALRLISWAGKEGSMVSSIICDVTVD